MTAVGPTDLVVRRATPSDRVAVRRVLDAAMLAVEELPAHLQAGEVLVATVDEHVCGAVVVAPAGPGDADLPAPRDEDRAPVDWTDAAHVRAVAVRRRRRGAGVGTALVDAAARRFGPLVADFDASLRPFYDALDAEVRTVDGADRCWARVPAPD